MKKLEKNNAFILMTIPFLAFLLEYLLIFIENLFFDNYETQNNFHNILIIIIWGLIVFLLTKKSRTILNDKKEKKIYNIIFPIIIVALVSIIKVIVNDFGFIGNLFNINFFELLTTSMIMILTVLLMFFAIVLSQNYFSKFRFFKNVPIGGIILGFFRILIVLLMSGDLKFGLYALILSIIYGIIYLISGNNKLVTILSIFVIYFI